MARERKGEDTGGGGGGRGGGGGGGGTLNGRATQNKIIT